MKIVVLDGATVNPGDNPWDPLAALGRLEVYDRTAPECVVDRAIDAEILLTNKTVLNRSTLEALPRLRYVGVLATGYNVVDVAKAGERGIPVSNVPGYSTAAVAQHTFALILELCNRVGAHDAAVHAGEWSACPDFSFWKETLTELDGLTLGIVGYGSIGQAVARIGRAMGMQVIAHTPRPVQGEGAPEFLSVEEVFARADVVSLHCPLTADNNGFVNMALLQKMKPTAFLINTARGALVDEAALASALNNGVIAAAAVDVVSGEPIAAENPLLSARNCMITPHIAWASLAARKRLMSQAAANVAAFLAGKPINIVNGLTR